ncbi:MAG: CoA pyrophosphatase [Bacteroidetes bacterium]|nr:MAG: CoA pyrophosphatase [Bacteroidota bacterium]GIV57307.1 MAG: coenzyme A pyrophosphatase [Rhodothermaceae bacterium]
MDTTRFAREIERLRTRLAHPLPGTEAQFTMAPRYRRDETLADVRGKPCRQAGVLALLVPHTAGAPAILLTVRRDHLARHAGQVSFPGGRLEPGESHVAAALRETHEEVGIDPASVDVLGPLTPLYIPPSNYCVYPFVGAVYAPPDLRPHDDEVAAVLAVPLTHLLDPSTRRCTPWTLRGRTVEVPFFEVEGHRVWGATAMMLAELLAVYAEATSPA